MYPLWIRLEYKEFGEQMGYTGSVTSRASLIKVVNRLDLQLPDIQSFIIDGKPQPQHVLERLFEEVEKGKEGNPNMKQGKLPTNKQKEIISGAGLRADKWLITKNLQHELHIVHRESGNLRIINL